jgi:hypothetical protein
MSMLMLTRLLRLAALVCTLLVAVGWLWFAVNQSDAASKDSAEQIAGQQALSTPDPSPDQERARQKVNTKIHEVVDDANDVLLRPFAPITADSGSKWVRRSVPALLALLVYGFGLSMLARYLAVR